MKKITFLVLAVGLGSALVLAGCSSTDQKVSDGVNKMLIQQKNCQKQLIAAIRQR
jgi:outer membrane murein-binding lipoprotein Lpp